MDTEFSRRSVLEKITASTGAALGSALLVGKVSANDGVVSACSGEPPNDPEEVEEEYQSSQLIETQNEVTSRYCPELTLDTATLIGNHGYSAGDNGASFYFHLVSAGHAELANSSDTWNTEIRKYDIEIDASGSNNGNVGFCARNTGIGAPDGGNIEVEAEFNNTALAVIGEVVGSYSPVPAAFSVLDTFQDLGYDLDGGAVGSLDWHRNTALGNHPAAICQAAFEVYLERDPGQDFASQTVEVDVVTEGFHDGSGCAPYVTNEESFSLSLVAGEDHDSCSATVMQNWDYGM